MALAILLSVAQEKDESWSAFSQGDYVKFTVTTRWPAMGRSTKSVITETIRKISEDEVVVEESTEEDDRKPVISETKHRVELPSGNRTKKGTESLTVDGKKFPCTVWEIADLRVWECPEAPGRVVRAELSFANYKVTCRLLKVSERVKVGNQELDCYVREISDSRSDSSNSKEWRSPAVPGHLVRATSNSHGIETTQELTEFVAHPRK